jgi:thiamine biosynthesis lipoprotein
MHIAAMVIWLTSFADTAAVPQRFEYSQLHMGVRVRIVLYAEEQSQARAAAEAAFRRFAELDATLSDYRNDSELNRLCARAGGGPVSVSRDLFVVLSRAREVAKRTGGAFDPTARPLVELWRAARRTGELPAQEAVERERTFVGWSRLHLNPKSQTAELLDPGMRLDLGGIAKGYACDEALRAIRAAGVRSALVEAGGDIALSEPPPGESGWAIRIASLGETLKLANCGISSSGDEVQFVEIGGKRYSHILDPRTGAALTEGWTVTLVGPDAFTTDPWATALSVLGDRYEKLVEKWAGVRVVAIQRRDH